MEDRNSPETGDDDFVTAQEAQFEEPYLPEDDDDRELDEGAIDEVVGLDDERRVDLADESTAGE